MSLHITSDYSRLRPGYDYQRSGASWIGVPRGSEPSINWRHIDGPLLYRRDGQLHWLTLWERLRCWLGYDDANSLDRKYALPPSALPESPEANR